MTIYALSQGALCLLSTGLCFFCFALSRRLRRLNDLETGLGGAIAVLISEVGRFEHAVVEAQRKAEFATKVLAVEAAREKEERAFGTLQQQFGNRESSIFKPAFRRRRKRVMGNQDA